MNGFVAALLTQAAHERLMAESWRHVGEFASGRESAIIRHVLRECESRAAEFDGRAEVYERFARRLALAEGGDPGDPFLGPVALLERAARFDRDRESFLPAMPGRPLTDYLDLEFAQWLWAPSR